MAVKTETRRIPRHPFSASFISAPLPEGFQRPTIEKYDGLSDPQEHLAAFNAHMLFYSDIVTDPLMCRTFPTTLTKSALRWFFTLPPGSINTFSDLSAQFLERHALCKVFPKTHRALLDVRQRHGEPLREYFNRFNQVAVQIDRLPFDMVKRRMDNGLIPGRFGDSLYNDRPQNLRELWWNAKYYVNIEEEGEDDEEEEPEPEQEKEKEEEEEEDEDEPTSKRRNTRY